MANERISWAGTDDGSLQYVTVATRPSPPRVGLRQYHGPNVARICQPTYSFPVTGHSQRITPVCQWGPLVCAL
ncbi:hypothetical protein DPMN_028458 [Dreissena polymorpha]|uniref:Uncharacterized protein n=1 Tax=Dreissena polymorpha TaxID=45954 RepID=A0A9D4LX74_DREPO|nr:hypothetical protein DPMN_028458 [Dreissena polymorpha]